MPLADGQIFAGYEIIRMLGSGGMGEVYLAQHPRLPRLEALKILPTSLTDDDDFRQRFNREADLAASLWHPNIVGLHDCGEFEGQLWIAMDYVDGSDAVRLLRERYTDGLPELDGLEIVAAVADALDYAHQRKLDAESFWLTSVLLVAPTTSAASRRPT
jgi:serine/threonine-protein kinase